jgi:energy-coupling factor transporter transmembrane protein EcfT
MKNFNDYSLARQWKSKTGGYVQAKAMPHSAAQIYLWICLAVAAQILHGYALTLLAVMLVLLTLGICAKRFFSLLRRTRWILLSIFVIYAYASRGDAMWPQLGAFSPVAVGMEEGFVQLQRLLIVLAGLSILLVLLSQAQLMEGFYTLLFPVFLVGLSRERVAVRLALTLRYAESTMQNKIANWHRNIEQMLAPVGLEPGYIELQLHQFSWRDWLLVAVSSAVVTGLWL